jgi:hypothetical protein
MNEIKGLYSEGTGKSPKIEFTHLTGELLLEGRSIPENAAKVYEPILTWINEYVKFPCAVTNLHLKLEYFNSASLVWITKIVIALGNIELKGAILYIHLYFEIEDFDDNITDELHTIIDALAERIHSLKLNIAFKTHGIDSNGEAVKESTILI